jgi:hypothetical protein
VTYEYLLEKGNVNVFANLLSRFYIYGMKIQEEEEVLTLLSGSENCITSNIKSTIPIHTALIMKEQAKFKGIRLI